MKRGYFIVLIGLLISAFFPAYLWYQAEHAWVWYIFTIGFALSCYIPFLQDHGMRWWISLIAIGIFWYVIESIGVLTCFPYWCFWYSNQLGIKLFNIVPLMLIFTRPPLVLWIWSVVKNQLWRWWKMRLVWWIWLVIIDLVLDPIAVLMWLWSYPWWWIWFNVPLSNFLWRMLSGTISMIILDYTIRNTYNKKTYIHGLSMTMIFFIWYALWKLIILY